MSETKITIAERLENEIHAEAWKIAGQALAAREAALWKTCCEISKELTAKYGTPAMAQTLANNDGDGVKQLLRDALRERAMKAIMRGALS